MGARIFAVLWGAGYEVVVIRSAQSEACSKCKARAQSDHRERAHS